MTPKQLARLAGLIYLVQALVGSFPLYVRARLIAHDDASGTMEALRGDTLMFRLSLVSEVGVSLTWLMIAFLLYCIFQSRQHSLSLLFLVFTLVGCATITANVGHLASAFDLAAGYSSLPGAGSDQAALYSMLLFSIFDKGQTAWSLWAGLWLIPLGIVIRHADGVPKFFGPLLVFASLGYVLPNLASYLLPEVADKLRWAVIFSGLAEMSWGFWLLFKGVDERALGERSSLRQTA